MVPAAERAEILALARDADDEDPETERVGCWVRPHLGMPGEAARSVLFAHTTATTITGYHPGGLPIILRTKELLAETGLAEAWRRYRSLLNNVTGPGLLFYLRETGLRALDAPADVREAQFIQLAMLAGQERVRLRIVPAGRDPGLGGFTLLRFPEPSGPAVTVPCDTVTLILEGQHFPVYQRQLEILDRIALAAADSQTLIMKLIDT